MNFNLTKKKLAMRIFLAFTLINISIPFLIASNAYGQTKLKKSDISYSVKNESIQNIFTQLSKLTGFYFFYDESVLKGIENLSLDIQNKNIDVILTSLTEKTSLSFKQVDNTISVSKEHRNKITNTRHNSNQISKKVSGIVKDKFGVPVIGATILEKGSSSNGTVTDIDGNFSLEVSDGAMIVISYIGYTSQELSTKGNKTFNITIKEDVKSLEEVVVLGYGVQKKQTVTAAASTLDVETLESLPSTNIAASLAGRVSGLLVQQGSGEAGYENPKIIIRGSSSPTSSDPLIVVDGIVGRSMSQLDPSEIANMTVLKDASAVAPYGARGANGVILITTKRGESGRSVVNYSVKGGFGEPTRLPEIASSYDHARLMNEAWRNKEMDGGVDPGAYGKYTEEELMKFKNGTDLYGYPNTNWLDEVLLPKAWQQQHSINASGGSKNVQYFVGFGYVDQDALYGDTRTNTPSSGFKRYNFRANLDAVLIKDVLKLSADIAYREENRNTIAESTSFVFHNMYRNPQTDVGRFPDGNLGKVSLGHNPIGLVTDGGWVKDKKSTINSNFVLDLTIPQIEGLNLKGVFSYDKMFNKTKTWETPVTYYVWNKVLEKYDGSSPNREGSDLEEEFAQSQYYTVEFQANYNKKINDDHQIGALFVFSASEGSADNFWAARYKYQFSSINQLFAGPDKDKDNSGYASENGKLGTVFRATYNYKEKYMLEANGRIDGSEKFPKNKRFGFFPSVSAAWRISEEGFLQPYSDIISNLKLRTSWGKAGTDNIARFQYMSAYGVGDHSVFGNSSPEIAMGYTETRFPNPNITWETSEMFNIGFDASLWNRLLSIEADFFYKKTTDILRERTDMPGFLGYTLPAANVGIVDNRGVEVNLTHNNTIGDFNYSVSGNVTWARNKVIDLLEPDGQKNNPRIRETGHPMNQLFGYESLGIFQSKEEANSSPQPQFGQAKAGDIKYKDQNGDGKIDAEDNVAIGKSQFPELIFGVNLSAEYKGFDLQLFFQGAGMTDFYYSGYLAKPYLEAAGGTLFEHHINNTWTPENPNAEFPRLYYGNNANNAPMSSHWLRDGSYIRLKNIELGYNLKTSVLKKVSFISALRVFANIQNLFTLSEIKYFDPEIRDSAGKAYPQMKTFILGANISF